MLLPISGTYLVFKHLQYNIRKQIKKEIKKGVSEEDLILLKIPLAMEEIPNPVFKRIHSREFKYKGEMYDIVRQENHGDTTWYWCIWDKEETALFAQLNKAMQSALAKDPVQKDNNSKLLQFYKTPLFAGKPLFDFANRPQFIAEQHSIAEQHLISRNIPPPTPPPKNCQKS